MDIGLTIALVLLVVHIVAFIAGGANSVVMPIIGRKLATATPDVRAELMDVAGKLAKSGKYAMIALIVTGLLVFWLKWNFVVPNLWFWVKMAGIAAMLVLIGLNEATTKRAGPGNPEALRRSAMYGQLTGVAFLIVVIAAVFAFN